MAVNNDKLIWVFTEYGLNRINEALVDSSVTINLFKLKIGDANGTYYTPSANQTSLMHQVSVAYNLNEKSKDDSTSTVSFKTTIDEVHGGFSIREAGLYETIDGTDYLFAVSTFQEIIKPSMEYNYFYSINFEASFRSTNLMSIYDQIILDENSEYVKKEDFDMFVEDLLWVEGNFAEQIQNNANVIGLNRATQLKELIDTSSDYYSNICTSLNFSNLGNLVGASNVYAYWVFNYSKRNSGTSSVVDFSDNSMFLASSMPINTFSKSRVGLAPLLDFNNNTFYSLDSSSNFTLTANNSDTPILISGILKRNTYSSKNTILADSNYTNGSGHLELYVSENNELVIKFMTDTNNYIQFKSDVDSVPDDIFAYSIYYNGNINTPNITAYINFNKIENTVTEVGSYTGMTSADLNLGSYVTNSTGVKESYINSKVSLLSVVKATLTDNVIKNIVLSNLSYMGIDTCLIL